LLEAAERVVEGEGVAQLSLRGVARDAGTTTRAVYSLFGSKEGLVVALGARAFELLSAGLDAVPATADPRRDLVDAALMFRRFALAHPALFSIAIQRTLADRSQWEQFRPAAWAAFAGLEARFERLADLDLLGGRTPREAAFEFHAFCEGLTAVELRGTPPGVDGERLWRDGVYALVVGLAAPPPRRKPGRRPPQTGAKGQPPTRRKAT
jgi:AcrR family transcriptional regulator